MISSLTSQTIKLMRLPLMIHVVCIHMFQNKPVMLHDLYERASFSLSFFDDILNWTLVGEMSRSSVPILFVIAGFLFFQQLDQWHSEVWKTKMKSRFLTIFMPYFVWNTLYIASLGVLDIVVNGGSINNFFHYLIDNNWHLYWDYNVRIDTRTLLSIPVEATYPELSVFWFIRDLIVSFVLSPLIYWLIKYLKHAFIILLSIAYLLDIPTMFFSIGLGFNYWICLGAYIAVNGWDLVAECRRVGKWAGLLSFVLWGVYIYFYDSLIRIVILPLYIFCFSTFIVYLFSLLAEKKKGKLFEKYSSDTFFIFALHYFFTGICTVIFKENPPPVFILFLIALLITVLCIVSHRICIRFLPHFTFLLTGKRYERKKS